MMIMMMISLGSQEALKQRCMRRYNHLEIMSILVEAKHLKKLQKNFSEKK